MQRQKDCEKKDFDVEDCEEKNKDCDDEFGKEL